MLTASGLESLKKELEELKVKLAEVMARVARAREDGDLSENSAYQFGKQEQEFISGRMDELDEIIKNSKLVTVNSQAGKNGIVDLGCSVTVSVNGKKQVFQIVGEWEAKPAEKKISGSSPLGKALMGKKVGEKVEVQAPAGKVTYSILRVE